MRNLIPVLLMVLLLASCGSSKRTSERVLVGESRTAAQGTTKVSRIVDLAMTYEGTRYKFGGTDKRGMDCSGLVYTCFQKESVALPRVSRDMANQGTPIRIQDAEEGDLLFFQTNKNRRVINHVGLVVEVRGRQIKFIHATTSRGVIVSTMDEAYWKNAFIEARRLI